MALTAKRIAKLVEPGRYGDGRGLYLQVTPTGVRSWILRFERNGRERAMGLGPLHTFDLEEARELARKARQELRLGHDPIDSRKAAKQKQKLEQAKTKTFAECADEYFAFHEGKWNNAKWRSQFKNTMRDFVLPKIGKLSIAAIDTGLVLQCVEEIWRTKTPTAARVRQRLAAVLDWATVRNYRSGENPARWDGHLQHILPAKGALVKTKHHAALPFTQVHDCVSQLRQRNGIPARALEFLILTAARTSEVTGALWSEIDFQNKTWTIPAARMKAKKDHRIPLSDRAIVILQKLPRLNDFIFAGERDGKAMGQDSMDKVLERMGFKDRATVHGFRSTFRDWAAERTTFPNHVVEAALAHQIGSAVERAYRRGDLFTKRVRLMADWARYCETKQHEATITSIRARV
jgi:integrase